MVSQLCDICGKAIKSYDSLYILRKPIIERTFRNFNKKIDVCPNCWSKINKYCCNELELRKYENEQEEENKELKEYNKTLEELLVKVCKKANVEIEINNHEIEVIDKQ